LVPCLPRGKIAVTPVRTGPLPTTRRPSPEISVLYPTSTPATSVIAFSGPGVPSKGTPRSRARGCALLCDSVAGITAGLDAAPLASICAVAAMGLWLVWRKGGALIAALSRHVDRRRAVALAPAYAGVSWRRPALSLSAAAYRAGPPGGGAAPIEECGHSHAPDPAQLNGTFSWREAAGTVVAAGARPCSGAILVLVFATAQGLFAAGVAATFAMAVGTAATTGALAWIAVFAKSAAMRLAAGENSRLALVARGFEFVAALAVLTFGVALLIGSRGAV